MNKVLVIVGPTASGKSHLAMELAKNFNGEIINGDAFHVYKELSIGTNKPSLEDTKEVNHHLFSVIHVDQPWNVKIFQHEARLRISEISNRKKLAIICGGTGLYIDAAIKDYKFADFKTKLDYSNLTNQEIWNRIAKLDKEALNKISINNRRRLENALNILELTKKKKSENDNAQNRLMYDVKVIFLNPNKEMLKIKIKNRMNLMLESGWKQEVEKILNDYPEFLNMQASKALGYSEILNEDFKPDLLYKKTALYAKRQVTWFKNKSGNNTYTINDFFNEKTYNTAKQVVQDWICRMESHET